MKNIILIAILSVLSFSGCKKDPSIETPTLIGVWLSENHDIQFSIRNTEGHGSDVTFLQYSDSSGSWLKFKFYEEETLYKILSLTQNELLLEKTDGQDIRFFRVE